MKREQLLEAIGGVSEEMLLESEQRTNRSGATIRRVILVAAAVAALAITAVASAGIFSRPIGEVGLVTDETVAPFEMDTEGNIIMGGVEGQKVTMQVQIDPDAPAYLEELYYLELSERWKDAGGAGSGDTYIYYTWERWWETDGKPGRLRLHQSTTSNYTNGVSGKNVVDMLRGLPSDVELTTQKVTMAGLEMLKLTIPKLPDYDESQGHLYCTGGETRLYWSDGRYLLQLDYPYWVTDEQAEKLLQTLHIEKSFFAYPEDFGTVNAEKIIDLMPYFEIEPGNTGTTVANAVMGLGRFAYGDGGIYYSDMGHIYHYNLETGVTKTYILSDKMDDPMQMFITENYICYTDSWSKLVAQPKDGSPGTILYEGIHSGYLYADGMTLYSSDGRIDLRTGRITPWDDELIGWYVGDEFIYGVEGSESKSFLRIRKDTMEAERIELSFAPITVLADGEDLYFTETGAGDRYCLVHYRDGVETKLPIRALEYQILDGHVIYRCEDEAGRAIKSYNLETGEIKVLQEGGFNFSILEKRYVCLCCADDQCKDYCTVLDWQTGEYVQLVTE